MKIVLIRGGIIYTFRHRYLVSLFTLTGNVMLISQFLFPIRYVKKCYSSNNFLNTFFTA